MERNYVTVTLCIGDTNKACIQSDSQDGSWQQYMASHRILKTTHQGAAPVREQRLMSTTALLLAVFVRNWTIRIPPLFSGLRRFVYLVRSGAGRWAELISDWQLQ